MLQVVAELIDRQTYGASQELRLRTPDLARQLGPGQPVLVRTGASLSPCLRRTFYPIALDDETWTLRIPPSGDWGHAWLRAAPVGSRVDCLGPVGKGYDVPADARNLLCLGEGEEAWSLLPAVLRAEAQGTAVTLATLVSVARDAIPAGRLPAGVEYRVVSKTSAAAAPPAGPAGQGSAGEPGAWLTGLLSWADAVLAAGSAAFYGQLALAAAHARYGLSRGLAQVLYPATILCGTGACQACAVDVAGGRRRACLRGPVFDLVDVQP